MTVRKAQSLDVLFAEFNTRFPNRSKISDGWLGDASHRSRTSDHNAWIVDRRDRVVSAIDVTEDAEGGFSEIVDFAVRTIIANRDERVKYVIHEGLIYRSYDKVINGKLIKAWTPVKYTGPNAHEHHGHFSVKPEKRYYDSTKPWGLLTADVERTVPHAKGTRDLSYRQDQPVMVGGDVVFVQRQVGVKADGWYGEKTAAAVRKWEQHRNATVRLAEGSKPLLADGVVGVGTWKALGVTPTYKPKATR